MVSLFAASGFDVLLLVIEVEKSVGSIYLNVSDCLEALGSVGPVAIPLLISRPRTPGAGVGGNLFSRPSADLILKILRFFFSWVSVGSS